MRLKLALYPILGDLRDSCIRIALKYGLTVYDASYVSLSRLLNSELYTADEKLISKAKREATVHHITEYSD